MQVGNLQNRMQCQSSPQLSSAEVCSEEDDRQCGTKKSATQSFALPPGARGRVALWVNSASSPVIKPLPADGSLNKLLAGPEWRIRRSHCGIGDSTGKYIETPFQKMQSRLEQIFASFSSSSCSSILGNV